MDFYSGEGAVRKNSGDDIRRETQFFFLQQVKITPQVWERRALENLLEWFMYFVNDGMVCARSGLSRRVGSGSPIKFKLKIFPRGGADTVFLEYMRGCLPKVTLKSCKHNSSITIIFNGGRGILPDCQHHILPC